MLQKIITKGNWMIVTEKKKEYQRERKYIISRAFFV
jgi:hypothetical protein